jgi:hypothetical protein
MESMPNLLDSRKKLTRKRKMMKKEKKITLKA